ncbi:MAG: ACT domain-containing protein, partial [Alphaproteobacteria bacterium]
IECLMQFNMYHHYTVDEHSIRCISVLSRIERGELREELPIASEILKGQIDRPALYLACLLHDIGKGRERDHSELGAEIAERVCARLGVDDATRTMVVWLVRHHLLMSDVAQKRDIADPQTVRNFARTVQSTERLKLLCVLTVCDIMAVGPGVWNNWKAQLLRQLYRTTWQELTGTADGMSRAQMEQAAREAFAEAYAAIAPPEEVEAELGRHYPAYWLGFDTATQLAFAEMKKDAKPGEILSRIIPDPDHDATRAMFYLEDHPGIFSRLAGALAIAGANVVDARTYTTRDAFATTVFWIQDRDGKPYEKNQLDRLRRSVRRSLKGEWKTGDELKSREKVKRRERDFTVPTRITFDNDGSDIFTIIEVSARDRPGLLYDLTRTLANAHVSISSAVIVTYGAEAVDVFYVKDLFGLKIRNKTKLKGIEARLRAAIDGQQPDE